MEKNKGTALILILLFLLLLVSLILRITENSHRRLDSLIACDLKLEGLSLCWGGINYGLQILSKDDDRKVDWLGEDWAKGPFEWENGKVRIWIEDEERKINLNFLKKEKEKRKRIEQLLELCDITSVPYTIVPSLLDWIDEDEEVTVLPFIRGENCGAEEEYYTSLPHPYHVKNALLDIPEEILLIRGMKEEYWLKEDGWRDKVTVWGNGKINVNTASFQVLKATLQVYSKEIIDDSLIEELIEVRESQPFDSLKTFAKFLPVGVGKKIIKSTLIDVKSTSFSIIAEVKLEKIRVKIKSVWEREDEEFRLKYLRVF